MASELYNNRVRELFGMHRGNSDDVRMQSALRRTADSVESLEDAGDAQHLENLRVQVEQHKLLKRIESGISSLNRKSNTALIAATLVPRGAQPRDARGRYTTYGQAQRPTTVRAEPNGSIRVSAGRLLRDTDTQVSRVRSLATSVGRAALAIAGATNTAKLNAGRNTLATVQQANVVNFQRRTAASVESLATSSGIFHTRSLQLQVEQHKLLKRIERGLRNGGANSGGGSDGDSWLDAAKDVADAFGGGDDGKKKGGAGSSDARRGRPRGRFERLRNAAGTVLEHGKNAIRFAGRWAGPALAAYGAADAAKGAVSGFNAPDVLDKNVGTRAVAGMSTAMDRALDWGLGNPLNEVSKAVSGRGFTDNVLRGWDTYTQWAHRQVGNVKQAFGGVSTGAAAMGPGADAVRDSLAKTPGGQAALAALGLGVPSGVDLSPIVGKQGRVAPAAPVVQEPGTAFPADRWATDSVGLLGSRKKQINDATATAEWFRQATARRTLARQPGGETLTYGTNGVQALTTTITTLRTNAVEIKQALREQTDAVVGATSALEGSLKTQTDSFDKLSKVINNGGVGGGFGATATVPTGGGGSPLQAGGGNGSAAGDNITSTTAGNDRATATLQRAAQNRATARLLDGKLVAPVTARSFTAGDPAAPVNPATYSTFGGNAPTDYRNTKVQPGALGAPGGYTGALGALSAQHEGKVDTAGGDGGRAYGKYQFDYTVGGLQTFFGDNPDIAKQFAGLAPGSPAFNARWKSVAAADPKGFEAAQDRSARALWYAPAESAARDAGFKVDNRGVQEAMFSGGIQHGNAGIASIVQRAAQTPGFANMSAEDQLRAFYAARRTYDGVTKLDPGRRAGVLNRYDTEEQQAITMASAPGASGGAGAPTAVGRALTPGSLRNVGELVPFAGTSLGRGPQGDALAARGDRRGAANLFSGRNEQSAQRRAGFSAKQDLVPIRLKNGETMTVHRDAAYAFTGFFNEMIDAGYPVKSSGGYNDRNKRGGTSKSEHAFGTAADINAPANPMSRNLITDMLPFKPSERAAKWGLSWGGDWKSTKDAMHFEWRGISEAELLDARNNPTGAAAVKVQRVLAQAAETGGADPKGRGAGLAGVLGKGGGLNRRAMGERTKDDLLDPANLTREQADNAIRVSKARVTELDRQIDVETARENTIERADRSAAIADTVDGRGGRVGGDKAAPASFDERWGGGSSVDTTSQVRRPEPPRPVDSPVAQTTAPAVTPTAPPSNVATPTPPPAPPPVPSAPRMADVPDIGELKMLMANSNMMA